MPGVDINYLAVFVGAIISLIVGAVWYSPALFADSWMKELGKKLKDVKNDNAPRLYVLTAFGALAQTYVLAHFVQYAGADTLVEGANTGFWLWFAFTGITLGVNNLFAGRSLKLWQIDSGYFLVVLVINAALLAIWL